MSRRIVLRVDTGFVGCVHKKVVEIGDHEIVGMSEDEIKEYFDEIAEDFRNDMCSADWEEAS